MRLKPLLTCLSLAQVESGNVQGDAGAVRKGIACSSTVFAVGG